MTANITAARAQVYAVSPPNTDPDINPVLAPAAFHRVHVPTNAPRNRLLVFLPGSNARPSASTTLLETAADAGLHAIGLVYVNTFIVNDLGGADCAAYEPIRREIIEGQDYSPLVSVSEADSIINRLTKLVQYMDGIFPAQNWGHFLDAGNQVIWSNLILAGHSQGGGHAAVIARHREVGRCILFSTADWCGDQPADWVTASNATPAFRYFGFHHEGDAIVSFPRAQQFWDALGLSASTPQVQFEAAPGPPYEDAHLFRTTLTPLNGNGSAAHNATALDANTPTNSQGHVIFRELWRYMLTGPLRVPDAAIAPSSNGAAEFAWEGEPAVWYRIDRSTNGIDWVEEGEPIPGAYGVLRTNAADAAANNLFRLRVLY